MTAEVRTTDLKVTIRPSTQYADILHGNEIVGTAQRRLACQPRSVAEWTIYDRQGRLVACVDQGLASLHIRRLMAAHLNALAAAEVLCPNCGLPGFNPQTGRCAQPSQCCGHAEDYQAFSR